MLGHTGVTYSARVWSPVGESLLHAVGTGRAPLPRARLDHLPGEHASHDLLHALRHADERVQVDARLHAHGRETVHEVLGADVAGFFFSSRRRHTRSTRDWSSDVCSSDLRRRLRSCDLIFIDPPGAEALAAEGITTARPANLYGCDRAFLDLCPVAEAAKEGEIDRKSVV